MNNFKRLAPFVFSLFSLIEMSATQSASMQVYTERENGLQEQFEKKKSVAYYAELYEKGKQLQKLNQMNEAIGYFKKSAEGNNTDALDALAFYFFKKDNSLAEQYARRGAVLGHVGCQLWLGQILCELGETKEGLSWLVKSAEQGQGWAQFLVGQMYEIGEGANKDMDKAIYWYRISAKNVMNYYHTKAREALKRLNVQIYDDGSYMEQVRKMRINPNMSPEDLYDRGYSWKYSGETPKKFAYLIASAEKGYPQAQKDLGDALVSEKAKSLGIYDEAKSKEWHSKAFDGFMKQVEAGNVLAMEEIGDYYYRGKSSVQKDIALAEKYYRMGAELGSDDCQLWLGQILRKRGQTKEALEWFEKSGKQGQGWSAYLAGEMYEKGEGTPKNPDKAIEWYRKSAHTTNAYARRAKNALHRLGAQIYEDDNYMESVRKIRINPNMSPEDLYDRGYSWKYSEETPEKFAYLIASAEKGYPQAQKDLGDAFVSRKAKSLGIYDEAKSKEWHSKAFDGFMKQIETGNVLAMEEIGDYYYRGKSSVQKDIALAEKYYRMGAELGSDDCQLWLGQILRKRGQTKEALEWFEKSGKQGQGWSAYLAGEMYEKGEGSPRNLDKAIEWYRKSAHTTNAYAKDAKDALRRLEQPVPGE